MTPSKRAILRIVKRKFLKRSLNTRDLSLSFARNGVIKRDMIASVAKGSKQERMMKLARLLALSPETESGERRRPKLFEDCLELHRRMFMQRESMKAYHFDDHVRYATYNINWPGVGSCCPVVASNNKTSAAVLNVLEDKLKW
jgi:hypothetical protein